MTDLLEEDPDAEHQGELIITVLGEGYQRNAQGLCITYNGGFQPRGVCEREEGGICVIQAGFAFRLEFVKVVE